MTFFRRNIFSFFWRKRLGSDLIEAIRSGNRDRVAGLLQQGAPLEFESTLVMRLNGGENRIEKVRPLMWAAYLGHVDIAALLLHTGAKLHARNEWQQTALMLAIFGDQARMISFLIRKGARVNGCDYSGRTVLMQAIGTNNSEIVRILVKAGVKLDDYTMNIGTALNLAYSLDKKEMILILEDAKATKIDWDDLYQAPP